MNPTMRVIDLGTILTEPPNHADLTAFDPAEKDIQISPDYFRNKKISAIRWALKKVNRLIDLDRLVELSRTYGLDNQVRPEAVRANKRILNYYARTRFTDGSITVPASSRDVIIFCEKKGMRVTAWQ